MRVWNNFLAIKRLLRERKEAETYAKRASRDLEWVKALHNMLAHEPLDSPIRDFVSRVIQRMR